MYLPSTKSCFVLADKNGYFSKELFPLEVKGRKGPEQFLTDEHPRETSLEDLQKLKPVFKENGMVSAGNASVSSIVNDCCYITIQFCRF